MNFKTTFPPSSALLAFEAAARLHSFSAAAKCLCVSSAAISQHIKTLESFLGVPLFKRSKTGVELTDEGHFFYLEIQDHIIGISKTVLELRSLSAKKRNSISATSSIKFSSLWLARKIFGFYEMHPNIQIDITVTDECVDFESNEIECGIRYGEGVWDGLEATKLFPRVSFFPVCTPEYLEKIDIQKGLASISDARLLFLNGEAHKWENWYHWFHEFEIGVLDARRTAGFDDYNSVLRAAIDGNGLALAWDYLIDDLLDEEVLVRPFKECLTMNRTYYFVQPIGCPLSASSILFKHWVIETAKEQILELEQKNDFVVSEN